MEIGKEEKHLKQESVRTGDLLNIKVKEPKITRDS